MDHPIIIAGAGIGGLTAALALSQRGFKVRVLEQAGQLKEVGAGVQISPNGCRVLAALGLLDNLEAIAVEPEGKSIRLWNSGESWRLFDLGKSSRDEYGFPYLMVHRGDLQLLLSRALAEQDADALVLNAKVIGYEQEEQLVWVDLADGSRHKADLLIGADGVHSSVRQTLFGAGAASFSGCLAWRGVIDASLLPKDLVVNEGVNWVGPQRHVVTYPLRSGKLVNFVGVVDGSQWQEESWTARGSKAECQQDFAGWHEDIQTLIDHIDVHYRWALFSRPTLAQWSAGRVVLLGDACHPMLPFMAQGAVMAIEDGYVLARSIEQHQEDAEAAFQCYGSARVDRANRCVVAADLNRAIFHDDKLTDRSDASLYVATQWNEDAVRKRYQWLFSYDAVNCTLEQPKIDVTFAEMTR